MSIKEIKWNDKQYLINPRAGRGKRRREQKTDGENKNQPSICILIQTYSITTLHATGLNTPGKSQIFKLDLKIKTQPYSVLQ